MILTHDDVLSLNDYVTCKWVRFFPSTYTLIVPAMTKSKYSNDIDLVSHILNDDFKSVTTYKFGFVMKSFKLRILLV